ncbi:hypothetical protein OAN12_03800 [Halioglobus sp.]|nr:hypothetical protein [Halioglobus sp.]
MYNFIVAPAAVLFNNSLTLHRLISALFIAASCAICFLLCRKRLVSRTDSAIAASLFYAALLFYSTPIASPNSLGLFLFLTAIAIPYICGFSKRTLAATIGCSILAFFTKQYFLASLGYVALYLFLAISKKQSIIFGLFAVSLLVISIFLVEYTSPYFLHNTLFTVHSSAAAASDYGRVFSELTAYVGIYYPLFAIPLIAAAYKICAPRRIDVAIPDQGLPKNRFNFFAIDKPFLSIRPDYMRVCLACSIMVISFALGSNPGNHLTYLMQLITPFLLISIFSTVCETPRWRQVFIILIILMMYNSHAMLSTDLSVNEKNWGKIRRYLAAANDVYASTLVLPEIVREGGPVYADGHTRYFPFGESKPALFVKSNPAETAAAIWERHVRSIEQKILSQEYDLILMDQWMNMPMSLTGLGADPATALQTHYKKTDVFNLPLARRPGGGLFRMEVYEPLDKDPEDNQ